MSRPTRFLPREVISAPGGLLHFISPKLNIFVNFNFRKARRRTRTPLSAWAAFDAPDRATRLHRMLVAYAAPPRTQRAQPRFAEPAAPLTLHALCVRSSN